MIKRTFLLLLVLVPALVPARAHALYPVLDGFRVYSCAVTTLSGVRGAQSVAVQPLDSENEAKIIVGGAFQLTRGGVAWQNLVRLRPDGTRDDGFAVVVDGAVDAIAIQPDNRILIGGSFTTVAGSARRGLARLGSDGSLDPGFNPVTTQAPGTITIKAIALQKDATGNLSNILVGGDFQELAQGEASPYFASVSAAGAYQSSPPDFGRLNGAVNVILLQDSGRIILGGEFTAPVPYLARYAGGSLDGAFAPALPVGVIRSLVRQADGRILAGGEFSGASPAPSYLARLSAEGVLEGESDFHPGLNGTVTFIVLQPDGDILVAGDFTQVQSVAVARLARLGFQAGARDPLFAPSGPDQIVNSVALQEDGKILVVGAFSGAGGKARTALARFYPGGALDDDITPNIVDIVAGKNNATVTAVTPMPDGTTIVTGLYSQVQGVARLNLARFREDWSLDAGYAPSLNTTATVMVPLQDQSVLIGGTFSNLLCPSCPNLLQRVSTGGVTRSFNDNIFIAGGGVPQQVETMAVLPFAGPGQPTEEQTLFLGGNFTGENLPGTIPSLLKFTASGASLSFPALSDPRITADSIVWSIALQADGKVLVGTDQGVLLRLNPDGSPDPNWHPPSFGVVGKIYSIVVQSDGNILLAGDFVYPFSDTQGHSWNQNVLRLFPSGAVDTSFNVQALYSGTGLRVNATTLMSDGSMLIYGAFDSVKDKGGIPVNRPYVARITKDGSLDPLFTLGAVTYVGSTGDIMRNASVLPDAKIILGGKYTGINGIKRNKLSRFSYKSASQVLSVQQVNAKQMISWRRTGTGPELMWVWFEYCANPYAASPAWTWLGNAARNAALDGWEFDAKAILSQGLPAGAKIRANGYTAGSRGCAGYLVQSTLLYYPATASKPRLDVGPRADLVKSYGVPVSWVGSAEEFVVAGLVHNETVTGVTFTVQDASGSPLSSPPNASPAGTSYSVALSSATGPNFNPDDYDIHYAGAKLTVAKAELTISGDFSKVYGETANLSADGLTISALPNGDSIGSVALSSTGSPSGAPVGGSPYAVAATLSGGSFNPDNYSVSYHGQLIVNKAQLDIGPRADLVKGYGVPASWVGAAAEFVSGGMANNETVTGLTFTVLDGLGSPLSSPPGASPAGTSYRVALSSAIGATFNPGNYDIHYASAKLTVLKAELNLSGDFSKVYGETANLSAAGIIIPALPNGDSIGSVALSSAGSPGSAPVTGSPYAIVATPSGGSFNPDNYSVSYHGLLTVSKAQLSVTADDQTRSWQTANPPLTATFAGFVAGDSFAYSAIQGSPELATAATAESPVDNYPITLSVARLSAPNYSFTAVNGTLHVVKTCQEINFPPPGDRTFGDPPFPVQASSCNGLGISFSLAGSDPGAATLAGNILTITGAGSVVITASQVGNGSLETAPQVSRTLTVQRSGQAISFAALPLKSQGDPPFQLGATASSGLPLSYQSSDTGVAEISGSTVTLKGAGTAVITALQPGNGNFNAALPSSQPLTVTEEAVPPQLWLSALCTGVVTADPVLNIMGSARDPSGIASLTVNGSDQTGQASLFSAAVLLAAGANSIEVSAWDGAGNRATQSLMITFDATAPEITLSAPSDNCVSALPLFSAQGTVAPGAAVSVGVNGSPLQAVAVNNGAFNAGGVLSEGVNTIEISAELAGRVSRVKRSVTLSSGGPSVAILEPAEDIRTEQAGITVRGTAGDGAQSVVLDVAGKSYTPVLQAGAFQQAVTLDQPGVFRITARAATAEGKASLAQRNIIRVPLIPGDMDGNGYVDLRDAAALLRISLGLEQATAQALAHGDLAPLVNGVSQPDGKIDAGDVLLTLRKIVGFVDF